MSPTLSLFLGLTVLIPQAFSAVLPVHHAPSVKLVSSNHYKVPGTDIAITALPPFGPPLPSLPSTLACLAAAQSNISRTTDDVLIPRAGWRLDHLGLALAAEPLFPRNGTYAQLSSGLEGLRHLLAAPAPAPGARAMHWLVEDGSQGTVIKGSIAAAGGTATATAMATHKATATAGWRFRVFGDGG